MSFYRGEFARWVCRAVWHMVSSSALAMVWILAASAMVAGVQMPGGQSSLIRMLAASSASKCGAFGFLQRSFVYDDFCA